MKIYEIIDDAPTIGYWTPDTITWFAKYARNMTFKSEQAARDWVFHKFQYYDEQAWADIKGKNGPEKNRLIADTVPLYGSGKSFKIGKRIRIVKKPWQGVEIIRPSLEPILELGWINDFDGYNVLGIKMLPVRTLTMTERHSFTESGTEKVYRYAARIKEGETFLAIIVDTDGTILDGHHRYRAVRDVLKWKKIPALVVEILGD